MYVHLFGIYTNLSSAIITSTESDMLCNHSYAASSVRIYDTKNNSLWMSQNFKDSQQEQHVANCRQHPLLSKLTGIHLHKYIY